MQTYKINIYIEYKSLTSSNSCNRGILFFPFRLPHKRMNNEKFNRNLYLSKGGKTQQVTLHLLMLKIPQASPLFKKETLAQVFSCEFCEISKNTFFTNSSGGCSWGSLNVHFCLLLLWSFIHWIGFSWDLGELAFYYFFVGSHQFEFRNLCSNEMFR